MESKIYSCNCSLCSDEFVSDFPGRQIKKLSTHLKHAHRMTLEQYVLEEKYDGEHPLCACGCGEKVKFVKGVFLKYFSDHKNKMRLTDEQKSKLRTAILRRHTRKHDIEESSLRIWFDMYKDKDCNIVNIRKISGLDFRTLKKYWLDWNITTKAELHRYSMVHKYKEKCGQKNPMFQGIGDNVLTEIYKLISDNKGKYTVKFLKDHFGIKNSRHVLLRRLFDVFGKENVLDMVRFGLSSAPEVEFSYVLKFYFGDDNVKKQFRLEKKVYDFLLFGKLIVEYDGKYWHDKKKLQDDEKDGIAVRNGYRIFRVKDDEAHNLQVLMAIKEIVDEIQISSNNVN